MKDLNQLLMLLSTQKPFLYKNFGVTDLVVFGSFVRNEQTQDSDVDICVSLTPEAKTFDNFMDIRFFLEDTLNLKVDLVTQESIRQELKTSIFEEAIHV